MMKEGQLIAYFVERLEDKDRLVQFNCHTGLRESVVSTQRHILTFAISEHILTVLEDKYSAKKIVGQVANKNFNDSEIEVGRRISKIEGELDISCSIRGLNSLVIDKNKLMIFD